MFPYPQIRRTARQYRNAGVARAQTFAAGELQAGGITRQSAIAIIALLLSAALLSACGTTENNIQTGDIVLGTSDVVALEQGWSEEIQDRVWFSSFGSRLIPYHWFLKLEQADSKDLFRDNRHLDRLGFLIQAPSPHNPDGLPVGFARDSGGDESWVGLTCAACHTGEVRANGRKIRISGGAALINFTELETGLIAALKSTIDDKTKLQRFARALGGEPEQQLRRDMQSQLQRLERLHITNRTEYPYGHGRLDAFGHIFNAVAAIALDMPANARPPDAPVSFPVLWRAPHLDVVQWNGSAPNAGPGPLFQNVITALAVYGSIDIGGRSGRFGYPSSVDITNLGFLQQQLYRLKSPQWPEDILGRLNKTRMARGRQLYDQHCIACHTVIDRDDGEIKIRAVLTPVNEVGTDPRMAYNFINASVAAGAFAGRREAIYAGEKIAADASALDMVVHAATGAVVRQPFSAIRAAVRGYGNVYKNENRQPPDYYKARPLDGIWTSAPYLHNGSVPSLYEILLPPSQRSETFHVGNRELDIDKVGLATTASERASLFDTRLPGNANSGHLYGVGLSPEQRLDLLEYLKSL